ncbi:hypothetical protein BH24DEI2_BH24DEI2_26320 [soil metagenome]
MPRRTWDDLDLPEASSDISEPSSWSSLRKVVVSLNEADFEALQSLVDKGGFGSINAYVHTLFAIGERLAEHRQQGFTELASIQPDSGEQLRVTDLDKVALVPDIACSWEYVSRVEPIFAAYMQARTAEQAETLAQETKGAEKEAEAEATASTGMKQPFEETG